MQDLNEIKMQLDELKRQVEEVEKETVQAVCRQFSASLWREIKHDEVLAFVKKPYAIVPYKPGEWRLFIPRFIPLEVGWLEFQTECYDEQTRVLTNNGFKFFREITYEDKIATLNPITNKLEYHKPTKILSYEYNGKMLHFKGQTYDLLVTPNHNIFARLADPDKENPFCLIPAFKFLEKSDYRYEIKRNCEWDGEDKEFFDPPSVNGVKISNPKNPEKMLELPIKNVERIPIDVWLKFLGWYLSEGCLNTPNVIPKWTGRPYTQYRIQIANQNPEYLREISSTISQLGFTPISNSNLKAKNVTFTSKQLALFLKQFGKSKEKYIPAEIKNLPKEKLLILLDILNKGDGSEKCNHLRYTTSSKKLADDVAEIGLKCGYGVSILKKAEDKFVVGFSRRKVTPRIKRPKTVNYKGKVYCVQVPNHIIFVERNGKTCWCGNSYNVYRVNRYVDWLTPLPEVLKDELGIKLPDFKVALDWDKNIVVLEEGDPKKFRKKYQLFFSRQIDGSSFQIKNTKKFSLVIELLKDGVMPFRPKPVDPADLIREERAKFELRDYQKEAWNLFLKYSHLGIFYPYGAGKSMIGLYAIGKIRGRKLVVVPTVTLREQWAERIKNQLEISPGEVKIVTYHSAVKESAQKEYSLVVFDEVHHLPSNVFSVISFLKRKYTIGLSVSGDTVIPLKKRGEIQFLKIEDLAKKLMGNRVGVTSLRGGLETVGVDPYGKVFWTPIYAVHRYPLGEKKLLEVELSNGGRIKVTGDHSLLVWDKDNLGIRSKACRDLTVEDYLIAPKRTPTDELENNVLNCLDGGKAELGETLHNFWDYGGIKDEVSLVKVKKVADVERECFVYDLTTGTENFLGNDVFCHNSGSPYREDGRSELIFALTGYPVGVSWSYFFQRGLIRKPVVRLIILGGESEKLAKLDSLMAESSTTLVYCDNLQEGKMIAERFGGTFVNGETKNRLETLRAALKKDGFVILSRVGDEGVSLPEIQRVIEYDYLFGSRRQEAQRAGRLFHATEEGEHIVLMTLDEYQKYKKRMYSLIEKGIEVKIENCTSATTYPEF
ncbi:MAG: helicase-related protein [Candidatus Jordarchaeaceae archaeon]